MEDAIQTECDSLTRDDSLYVASKCWERVMHAAVKVRETFLDREPSSGRDIYVAITCHVALCI